MAEELAVSSSYLSAMETGSKELTESFVEKVVAFFKGNGINATNLYELADRSRKEIRINTEELDDDGRELVAAFARRFSGLCEEKKKALKDLIIDQPSQCVNRR